jgi:hypothetical protein
MIESATIPHAKVHSGPLRDSRLRMQCLGANCHSYNCASESDSCAHRPASWCDVDWGGHYAQSDGPVRSDTGQRFRPF